MFSCIKQLLFIIFFILSSSIVFASGMPRSESHLIILCYHHVNAKIKTPYNISENDFKKQLDIIEELGYQFVSLASIDDYFYKNIPLPAKAVAITFDDANQSVYQTAYPILRSRNIPWALFVYPSSIRSGKLGPFMNWPEIKEVATNGATIGSHAYWHPYLTDYAKEKAPEVWLNTQLVKSAKVLESELGCPIKAFAVPFGLWDSYVFDKLKNAGYRLVFNVNNSNNDRSSNPLDLNRQMISAGESVAYFKNRLSQKRLRVVELYPPNLSIQHQSAITLKLSVPDYQKYQEGEWTLREPRWGKIVLKLQNGQASCPLTLTKPGQYIPHVYYIGKNGESREGSWSFIYRKK